MELRKTLIIICFIYFHIVNARLTLEGRVRTTFDTELYESVLDSEECVKQMDHIKNNALLLAKFVDAGFRIPKSILKLSTADFGSYYQCLAINEEANDMLVEGKYCFITVPLQQNISIPQYSTTEDIIHSSDLITDSLISGSQPFTVSRSATTPQGAATVYSLGVCIPKSCTTQEWVDNLLFNVTTFGFKYNEQFCRLPNDKPFVAVDYIAIVVFSVIGILTILCTAYDLYHTHYLKKDPKIANIYFRMFSVYTNGRRLKTFTKNPNSLECMDGIRSLSMMWVVIGHTFGAFNFYENFSDFITWITSANAVWITTGLFTVDSFFFMTGLLLVYSTVGKLTAGNLIKNLHYFYLNRLFRVLPLLAALVLLQASFLHHIADGPYWTRVAGLTESCRHFWWSTLLNVQNYVNPIHQCIQHSWYVAIDIQLHILSPLVLFWILLGSRTTSWSALIISNLVVLTAATIFNFMFNMPSTNMTLTRSSEMSYYMRNFYVNTLTRASPFFVGLIYGYILSMWKGKKVKINKIALSIGWLLSFTMIAFSFYMSFKVMELTWDSEVGDNLFNSFMRTGWALALGWIVLACVKGYGGPLNWFLSLQMWKLPARISYAMYLYHYPIQFVITGMRIAPKYFSVWDKFFEFLGVFALCFIVSYVVTVTIDAPFSILIKILLEGGAKPRTMAQKPQHENGHASHQNPQKEIPSPENTKI